jgi:uncharacterized protein YutE (UPF0331/DUF86 family)
MEHLAAPIVRTYCGDEAAEELVPAAVRRLLTEAMDAVLDVVAMIAKAKARLPAGEVEFLKSRIHKEAGLRRRGSGMRLLRGL